MKKMLLACRLIAIACGNQQHIVTFSGKGGRKVSGTADTHKTALPASPPSKWPGVRLLLSLLSTEHKDNSTKLRILLGEACVAVYLSLLALAWSNCQPKQLYRLVVNSLKSGMWGMVFGGGLRSAVQQSTGTYLCVYGRIWFIECLLQGS